MGDNARRSTTMAAMPVSTIVRVAMMMTMTSTTTVRMSSASIPSAMGLGASLRDRATLPSPLRGLVPPGGYPSRLHSLRSFRADAWPAPRRARRRVPGPHDMRTIRAPCSASAASSSRRRCAPRSSSASPRSPRPAAPAIGIASARGIGTACAAGDGFAVHRPSHRAMLSRPRRCRPSCGRCRRCLDHLAAHDRPGSCRHVPPLKAPRRLHPAGFSGVVSPVVSRSDSRP